MSAEKPALYEQPAGSLIRFPSRLLAPEITAVLTRCHSGIVDPRFGTFASGDHQRRTDFKPP